MNQDDRMHMNKSAPRRREPSRHFLAVYFFAFVLFFAIPFSASATFVTTTISISICGNGIIDAGEVCDDGLFNTGAYGSTSLQRHCNSTCSGYGPYCSDGVLQALYGEQCDDGAANGTVGDLCSSACVQLSPPISTTTPPTPPPPPPPPPPPSSSGGGGAFSGNIPVRAQTRVILQGKAYPGSTVNILKDGEVAGIASADSSADFNYETSNVTPGGTTFGFWATDSKGIRSITFTTTFQVTQNAVTTVSNVYLPPTIDIKDKKVSLGDIINSLGTTAPLAKVSLFVDKEPEARAIATSSGSGAWSAAIPTDLLSNEAFHAVKAMFEIFGTGAQAKSGYSQALNFYVGSKNVRVLGTGDLNGDGKVNLTDFSILLFHWGTSSTVADINGDGKVDLTDFSILLFNWTG